MYETINGHQLYYERYGKGDRTIIACGQHFDPDRIGWPFDLADEGFCVYVLTMYGYGQSEHIHENHTQNWYDIWADDVVAFAHSQNVECFFYTGQSDGAGIGWHICMKYPDALIGFAGLAAGPHSRDSWLVNDLRRQNMHAAITQDPEALERLAQYQRQRILHFASIFKNNEALRQEFERKAEAYYQWQLNKSVEERLIEPGITLPQFRTDEDLLDAMREINFPVLLLYGMNDAMLPIRSTVMTMGAIPNAKVIFYQEANNYVHYSRREDVRREIAQFADAAFA